MSSTRRKSKKVLAGVMGAASVMAVGAQTTASAQTVQVQKGDTVWQYAQKFGVSVQSLETLNHIQKGSNSTDLIFAGQQLTIGHPTAAKQAKSADKKVATTYKTTSGDSLWSIAKRFNVSVAAIRAMNHLDSDLIGVGQQLVIPTASFATQLDHSKAVQENEATIAQKAAAVQAMVVAQQQAQVAAQQQAEAEQQAAEQQAQLQAEQAAQAQAVQAAQQAQAEQAAQQAAQAQAEQQVQQGVPAQGAQQTSTTQTVQSGQQSPAPAVSSQQAQSPSGATTSGQATASQTSTTANQPSPTTQPQTVKTTQTSQASGAPVATQTANSVSPQTATKPVQSVARSAAVVKTPVTVKAQTVAKQNVTAPVAKGQTSSVTPAKTPATATTSTSTANSSSTTALALKLANSNIPYVWGGASLSGMDCSGLVSYVYQHADGINLPHNTVAQEGAVTIHSVASAKAGDILFWGKQGASYHSAIYLGNGSYVAAPQPGQNVQVQKISSYFAPSFAGTVK